MKEISKNKKGISLIVLVITIIVMIILATAIILSLRSSGIINRANEAKTKSDEATLREAAAVKLAEYEIGIQTGDIPNTTLASEYIKDELKKAGIDTTGLAISPDGAIQTELSEIAVKFVELGVKVGDVVTGYDLSSNTRTSYTTDGMENTAPNYIETDPTPQTIARASEIIWKYMGLDESGTVLIVADSSNNLTTLKLSGKGGYLKGAEEINNTCIALYSSDMGAARSINIDDIISILKYSGHRGAYYDINCNYVYSDNAMTIGEILLQNNDISLLDTSTPDGSNINEYYSDYYSISKTSSYISATDRLKELVFQNTTYWLASSCVMLDCSVGFPYFFTRYVSKDSVNASYLFDCPGTSFNDTFAVRPVVKLASDVGVSYDGTTVTLS